MPVSSPSPFSKEVQRYARGCEHLLSAAVMNNTPPFTLDELEMLNYYSKEVTAMLVVLARMRVTH